MSKFPLACNYIQTIQFNGSKRDIQKLTTKQLGWWDQIFHRPRGATFLHHHFPFYISYTVTQKLTYLSVYFIQLSAEPVAVGGWRGERWRQTLAGIKSAIWKLMVSAIDWFPKLYYDAFPSFLYALKYFL